MHPRKGRILSALWTAVLGKGSVVLISILSVPITVRYLGPEQYGIWITISTTIVMLVSLDLGIANTLSNLITEAFSRDSREDAGTYFTTAFAVTAGLALLGGILGTVVWPHINFSYLLSIRSAQVSNEASQALWVATLMFLAGLPLGLATKVLSGYQEMDAANLFNALGNICSFLGILLAISLHMHLVGLVTGYSAGLLFGKLACHFWVTLYRKPWVAPKPSKFSLVAVPRITSSGGKFFLIQIAGLVVFNSDNLVISHFLSPAEVTPYSVTWRLVTYANTLQILLSQTLWPVYAEAWNRGDFTWLRRTYGRVRVLTLISLTLASGLLIPLGRTVIRYWAGSAAVPSRPLLILMCVWMSIYALTTNQSCLMGATDKVGRQAVSSIAAAVFNLSFSIYLAPRLGSMGVLLATVVSYVLFVLFVQVGEVRTILSRASIEEVSSPTAVGDRQ